jgi:hypothetical protein
LEIEDLVQKALDVHEGIASPDLETIQAVDYASREWVKKALIKKA